MPQRLQFGKRHNNIVNGRNLNIITMKTLGKKSTFQRVKQWLFEYIFIMDNNQLTSKYLLLLMRLLELAVFHVFYINPKYALLQSLSLFQYYFSNIYPFFLHLTPFDNSLYALLTLLLYPMVALLVLVIKHIGPNRVLVILVSLLIYLLPLLFIKIILQLISGCILGNYLYLILPCGLFNLLFAALVLSMTSRLHRFMELPFVLFLSVSLNQYAMMALLAVRLLLLLYLNYPRGQAILSVLFEVGCYLVLILCLVCDDQMLNYISFSVIVGGFVIYGISLLYELDCESKDIYHYVDQLQDVQEENEQAIFEIYRFIEEHHADCNYLDCLCHSFWQLQNKDVREWVYEFEEQRLRRKQSFKERIDYCNKCCEKYDFRLSGLGRISDYVPKDVLEQYQMFRVRLFYEFNLRRQDKNYKYGQVYRNVYEQIQSFNKDMLQIMRMIQQFWTLITNFDGSTKFLSSILEISGAISLLRQQYNYYLYKYDDEFKEFKYAFDLFETIILNEEAAEQDELIVPEPVLFLITNEERIVNTNNNFAMLVNATPEYLIGKSYVSFIPESYREMHLQWTNQFVEKVEEYQNKKVIKCLGLGTIEIKQVDMQHKVLPRFLQGLQIFTIVRHPVPSRNQIKTSFMFLVEKDTYFIKNVQSTFFDLISFKTNQRNFLMLQGMSLSSVFDNFSVESDKSTIKEVTVFPHFLEEFTYKKKGKKKAETDRNKAKASVSNKLLASASETEMTFEYEVIRNIKKQDPYLKVLFRLKDGQKAEEKEKEKQILEFSLAQTTQRINDEVKESEQIEAEGDSPMKKEQEELGYNMPIYLLGLFCIVHILYSLNRSQFSSTLSTLSNRYQFFIAFDYTTLYALGVFNGKNQTDLLKTLWVQGYGDFSESFNAFSRIGDSYFLNYFDSQVTVLEHNQLFLQIQSQLQNSLASINTYGYVLLIVMLAVLGHYVLDLILSLRYVFRIEHRVGELLLQFVVVDSGDVKRIIHVIQNFALNILNNQGESSELSVKQAEEAPEDSALDLIKSPLSANQSFFGHEAESESGLQRKELKLFAQRRDSRFHEGRVSLSLMQKQFQIEKVQDVCYIESKDKHMNIELFRQKYSNVCFILSANKKLFLMIFASTVLSCTTVTVTLLLLYSPMREFSKQITVMDSLYQSKIALLKSMQEIAISNYTLSPHQEVSTIFLTNQQQVAALTGNSDIKNFQTQYLNFMSLNMCSRIANYDCAKLLIQSQLPKYGMQVISQYIDEFIRNRNASALMIDNIPNKLIAYEELLIDVLLTDFKTASSNYFDVVDTMELNLIVIGTAGLIIGMVLSYFGLAQSKNRIMDSNSLLKIIPKEVAAKHKNQIGQLNIDAK